MTTDTTMTDVDTSRANINRILDKWRYRFGKDYELLGMIGALAAERDELERLAGEAHELIDQILGELDEAPIGPHKVELALLHERLTAYQRKGE